MVARGQDEGFGLPGRLRGVVRRLLPIQTPIVDNDPWVGKKVMTKDAGSRIGHSDPAGRQVYVADLTDMVYKVLQEKDGWLLLGQRGVTGWLEKSQAVPLDQAVAYFTQRIGANERDGFAIASRSKAWYEEGKLEEALLDVEEAIRLDPRNSVWLCQRGIVYDRLKETELALRDFDDALRLDGHNALAYYRRGIVRKAQRQYDQAASDYSQAIRLAAHWSDPYFNRGNAFKAKREYDQAIKDYGEAIRLDPQWADPYFNRANTNKARRDYEGAVRDYGEVIRLDSQDADAYGNLAWILATCPDGKLRDGKKALEYASRACDLTNWESPYFLAVYSAACAENGTFNDAIKWQQIALESRQYEEEEGEAARFRLRLFKDGKPYREK
jgi:tetratricopeptide (TPR) repeat protein